MPAVYNRKSRRGYPEDAVLVDRTTPFGNPYGIDEHGTRNEVIALFEAHVRSDPVLTARIKRELRGRNLLCHCKPKPCHADVLLRIANEEVEAMSIGVAMAGGNGDRIENDYYPTPYGTTERLLPYIEKFPSKVWECACGEGHMARILEDHSFEVIATDKVDRGYGTQLDFLKSDVALAPAIITNPPFKHADEFIVQAKCWLGIDDIALVLPLNFWCAQNRYELFHTYKPALWLPMTWRIDAKRQGRPTMNCAWCVWSSVLPEIRGFEPLLGGKAEGTLPDD